MNAIWCFVGGQVGHFRGPKWQRRALWQAKIGGKNARDVKWGLTGVSVIRALSSGSPQPTPNGAQHNFNRLTRRCPSSIFFGGNMPHLSLQPASCVQASFTFAAGLCSTPSPSNCKSLSKLLLVAGCAKLPFLLRWNEGWLCSPYASIGFFSSCGAQRPCSFRDGVGILEPKRPDITS